MIDIQSHREIEKLLYREARLLDERQFEPWLELWTMDCRYHVPVRRNVAAKPADGIIPVDNELDDDEGVALIDDNKMLLYARVMRLKTGKAWCENPPSRSRRFVSNIEIEAGETDGEYKVYSNLLHFRSRREMEENLFASQRRDIIVKDGENLLIKDRLVILDSNVLTASYAVML